MPSPSATANGTHWDLAPVARELLAQTVGREGGLATIKLTLHLKKMDVAVTTYPAVHQPVSLLCFCLWVFFGVPDGQLQLEPPAALKWCGWVLACQKDRLFDFGFQLSTRHRPCIPYIPSFTSKTAMKLLSPCCQFCLHRLP